MPTFSQFEFHLSVRRCNAADLSYAQIQADGVDFYIPINSVSHMAISPVDKEGKIYTDSDKFKKMVEINPELQKLKDELNLEIEF